MLRESDRAVEVFKAEAPRLSSGGLRYRAAALRVFLERIEFAWTTFLTHHQQLLRNSELRSLCRRHIELVVETDADSSVHKNIKFTLFNTKAGPGPFYVCVPARMMNLYERIEKLVVEFDARVAAMPATARAAELDRPFSICAAWATRSPPPMRRSLASSAAG